MTIKCFWDYKLLGSLKIQVKNIRQRQTRMPTQVDCNYLQGGVKNAQQFLAQKAICLVYFDSR